MELFMLFTALVCIALLIYFVGNLAASFFRVGGRMMGDFTSSPVESLAKRTPEKKLDR